MDNVEQNIVYSVQESANNADSGYLWAAARELENTKPGYDSLYIDEGQLEEYNSQRDAANQPSRDEFPPGELESPMATEIKGSSTSKNHENNNKNKNKLNMSTACCICLGLICSLLIMAVILAGCFGYFLLAGDCKAVCNTTYIQTNMSTMSPIRRTTANTKILAEEYAALTVSCDSIIDEVYIDGEAIEIDLPYKGLSTTVDYIQFPASANTIAIVCWKYYSGRGLIAHTTTGLDTTDSGTWRCSNKYQSDWMRPGFNDSDWPAALVTGSINQWLTGSPLPDVGGARGIWSDVPNSRFAYCRAKLP